VNSDGGLIVRVLLIESYAQILSNSLYTYVI